MASGREDEDLWRIRVRPGRVSGENRGSSGSLKGGWSRGFGGAMGRVRMPTAGRMIRVGKSAGKVAAASGTARMQRAVVKISYHKMAMAGAHARYLEREGSGLEQSTAHAHSEYLTRDGGGLEHEKAKAFDIHTGQPVDAQAMTDRWSRAHDAYHFRGIMAGERTPADMTEMLQEVISKAEVHLGTRLEGFAVHHHGGGNQHTHFVIRGRHENGKSLFIDPEYIKSGFRHSAEQYLTREYGERSDREIAAGHERSMEIEHERERGLERVQEFGLEPRDRQEMERVMQKGSMKEIGLANRKLDTLERAREHEQELGRDRVQEMERSVLDGSERQVGKVERQIDKIERVQEMAQQQTRTRTLDRGMDMGL